MAGNQNSGGFRPTAPQNNPANISATGGNGQSGNPTQGAKYMPGMPYGENTMAQQTAAPMAGKAEPKAMPMPTELFAPTTRPNEPITSGVDIGDGPGSEALGTMPNRAYSIVDTIKQLIPFDPSGDAELIYRKLIDEGY